MIIATTKIKTLNLTTIPLEIRKASNFKPATEKLVTVLTTEIEDNCLLLKVVCQKDKKEYKEKQQYLREQNKDVHNSSERLTERVVDELGRVVLPRSKTDEVNWTHGKADYLSNQEIKVIMNLIDENTIKIEKC